MAQDKAEQTVNKPEDIGHSSKVGRTKLLLRSLQKADRSILLPQ
jgi:hypothetical protein